MKIKRIKFQNYTVFEDQQMEFSPGINVIIGENGTGKTHLIRMILLRCRKLVFLHVESFRQRVAAWMRSLLVWVADLKCIQK